MECEIFELQTIIFIHHAVKTFSFMTCESGVHAGFPLTLVKSTVGFYKLKVRRRTKDMYSSTCGLRVSLWDGGFADACLMHEQPMTMWT